MIKSKKIRVTHVLIFAILLTSCNSTQQNTITGETDLETGFKNPPTSVRPWAYWVWTNGNVNFLQLTKDLEEIKAKGMGGFDIFDIGERFPEKGSIPAGPAFLGEESLKAIHHVMNEAKRLDLGLGLITSSSWNAGGSWVRPEHANMALFSSEKVVVKGPSRFSEVLPFPTFPKETPTRPDGMPVYYKDIAVLAHPNADGKIIKTLSSVKDLTAQMNENGQLVWDVPEGEWAITRFVCTNTGKTLHSPSTNSHGLVIDHFNPEATKMHFQTIIDKLQSEIGSLENSALKYLYLCSYEVWGISWTPNFQQEFLYRRGYSITPYLPVLLGYKIQNEEFTKRFYYDFEKTICDLIVDAHYKNATKISNKYGLQLCAESGGPARVPVESLKALGALDIPRGEFWYNSPTSLVKEIASAAHIYGRKLVDQEAFPSWKMWQEGPRDLKTLADNAFCNGMNKVTFHTYPHTPPEAGTPGWAFYAGTHIGPSRVWWPKAKPFMDYLSRNCYLLRQGLFVGDVCYYYGDQGFNYVPDKHIDPSLGFGYDYDVVNPEVILTRMEAENGKIVLPDGMSYELLVLPEREDMDLEVLKKIQQLLEGGITVVGPKPTKTNGLTNYPDRDKEVRKLADEIWGTCDGNEIKENRYGKGIVIWGRTLREILNEKGIPPDFSFISNNSETELDYIHRKTENEDIYFVRNKNKTREDVNCTFRVKERVPELWNPETGIIQNIPVYFQVEGGTAVSLNLAQEEAVFVVFRKNGKENGKTEVLHITNATNELEITGSWEVRFPEGWYAPDSTTFPALSSWTDNKEEGIKYFSGIAAYYKEFEIPENFIAKDKHLTLDLGEVHLLADVYLNGKNIGILWKSPFCADITQAAKPGKNSLVIEVANTWSNRLTGDAKLPEDKRLTSTNIKYVGGPLMKGHLWKDAPLLESGLIGPVRIISAKKAL
ncbi:MAG: hypothetical protein KAR19_16775 [Bacteroidales bacterium]|nr:hypothetical protein [Bacteroidales bacterium]